VKITDEQLNNLRVSFKHYDSNDDNKISKEELGNILKKEHPSMVELGAILDRLDANKDGFISFGEFIKAVKGLQGGDINDLEDVVKEIQSEEKAKAVPVVPGKELPPGVVVEKDEETIVKVLPTNGAHPDIRVEKDEKIVTVFPGNQGQTITVDTTSVVAVKVYHTFIWRYRGTQVDLVGDFTNWGESPISLKPSSEGFEATVPLHPGVYEYRFIIDGWFEWNYDILAPNRWNPYGYVNNVISL